MHNKVLHSENYSLRSLFSGEHGVMQMSKIIPIFLLLFSSIISAEEYLIVKVSGSNIELNGDPVSSIEQLKAMIESLDSNRVIIKAHNCLDSDMLVRVMGVFFDGKYIQVSLQSYGEANDSEC